MDKCNMEQFVDICHCFYYIVLGSCQKPNEKYVWIALILSKMVLMFQTKITTYSRNGYDNGYDEPFTI